MNTTTKTRQRIKPSRTANLLTVGASQVLALTVGKETTFYKLETLLADAGQGFRLVKADKGDGPGEEYDVLLFGRQSSCECKGFLRHHHCKHLESLAALNQAGKLSVPAPLDAVDQQSLEDAEAASLTCESI